MTNPNPLPHIKYPRGRHVHLGAVHCSGRLVAMCGWVPTWHAGATETTGELTCRRCLAGPRAWRGRYR